MKTAVKFGNLYLGNKMTKVPYFNTPWFDETASKLRKVTTGQVFNPAEWDRLRGFDPMQCPNGTIEEAAAAGFELRAALGADWEWIAKFSNGLVIGPFWATSKGTISEIACHQALGLPVWEAGQFLKLAASEVPGDRELLFDPEFQFPQLTNYLI